MDAFVTHSKAIPVSSATSTEIVDRASIFQAQIYAASSSVEVKSAIAHVRNVVHSGSRKASHEISAYRIMTLKADKTGLTGPGDFTLSEGSDDDGEDWAGARVLKVMRQEDVLDAVVIVSRWWGGTMLGPARFDHIENTAREVCRSFRQSELVQELLLKLDSLDTELDNLRAELAAMPSNNVNTAAPTADAKRIALYDKIRETGDVDRARKLLQTRELSIKSVRASITRQSIT